MGEGEQVGDVRAETSLSSTGLPFPNDRIGFVVGQGGFPSREDGDRASRR